MILATRLYDDFMLYLDKYGSPYFEDSEVSKFLTDAEIALIKEIFDFRSKDKQTNFKWRGKFENNSNIAIYLEPFTKLITGGMADKGRITEANVAAGNGGRDYMYILNLFLIINDKRVECKWLRHGELAECLRNAFTRPDECTPKYLIYADFLRVLPEDRKYLWEGDFIEYPLGINYDSVTPANNINSQFDEIMRTELVMRAVELATVSIRERELNSFTTNELDIKQV